MDEADRIVFEYECKNAKLGKNGTDIESGKCIDIGTC